MHTMDSKAGSVVKLSMDSDLKEALWFGAMLTIPLTVAIAFVTPYNLITEHIILFCVLIILAFIV